MPTGLSQSRTGNGRMRGSSMIQECVTKTSSVRNVMMEHAASTSRNWPTRRMLVIHDMLFAIRDTSGGPVQTFAFSRGARQSKAMIQLSVSDLALTNETNREAGSNVRCAIRVYGIAARAHADCS